jgi:hypothetical protein
VESRADYNALADVFDTGMAAQDQGFARFDHVRIPRTNMFSKFAEVTADGSYIQPPHAKLSYGGVIFFICPDIDVTDTICQMMYIRATSVSSLHFYPARLTVPIPA